MREDKLISIQHPHSQPNIQKTKEIVETPVIADMLEHRMTGLLMDV